MKIMGLDLSITSTGVCLPDGSAYTIKCTAKQGDKRLNIIRDRVRADAAGVGLVMMEDLPRHAHGAGVTGMVQGAVRVVLNDLHIPYVLVTPATLKMFATGKGNADKSAMILAAFKRGGVEFADDNQCDAWWLHVAGLYQYGEQLPISSLPVVQSAALTKVDWPTGLTEAA